MRMHQKGFTLLQLACCLAVLGILFAVAMPAWQDAMAATHATAAEASLLGSLTSAITRAGGSGRDVVLCPASAGKCTTSWDWSRGWVAFIDLDGDRHRDLGEMLVDSVAPLAGGVRLFTSRGRPRIVIQPNAGNAGSNATFTLCPDGTARGAVRLVLSNTGRLRRIPLGEATTSVCAG